MEQFHSVGLAPAVYQFVDMEQDVISGPVSQTSYGGPGGSNISGNTIMGPLTFSANYGGLGPPTPGWLYPAYLIGADTIYGPATCSDNVPPPNSTPWPPSSAVPPGTWFPPPPPSVVYGPVWGDQASTCTIG